MSLRSRALSRFFAWLAVVFAPTVAAPKDPRLALHPIRCSDERPTIRASVASTWRCADNDNHAAAAEAAGWRSITRLTFSAYMTAILEDEARLWEARKLRAKAVPFVVVPTRAPKGAA